MKIVGNFGGEVGERLKAMGWQEDEAGIWWKLNLDGSKKSPHPADNDRWFVQDFIDAKAAARLGAPGRGSRDQGPLRRRGVLDDIDATG